MPIYDITISNSGGSATLPNVWLVGGKLTKGWKNINKVEPVAGRQDIAEATQLGYENPVINVEGHIDINNTSGTYTVNGVSTCYKLQEGHLISMSALPQSSVSYLVLRAAYGTGGTFLRWYDGTGSSYTSSLNTAANVILDSWTLDIPSDSDHNHLWNYQITFIETKRPGAT